jgi:hypothetical protein
LISIQYFCAIFSYLTALATGQHRGNTLSGFARNHLVCRMPKYLQQVDIPERCFLQEVLLWAAFQRLPLGFASGSQLGSSWVTPKSALARDMSALGAKADID